MAGEGRDVGGTRGHEGQGGHMGTLGTRGQDDMGGDIGGIWGSGCGDTEDVGTGGWELLGWPGFRGATGDVVGLEGDTEGGGQMGTLRDGRGCTGSMVRFARAASAWG